MKALKILKERYKELSYFSETQREASNKLVSVLVEMVKVNEAIKELEALQQHIKSLEAQLANTEQLTCEYKEDNDIYMGTVYNFNCGYSYVTIEGDLKENGVNYCPSCGGKITTKDTQ